MPRRCDGCGDPLAGRQRRWCSPACSQRAYRERKRGSPVELPQRIEVKDGREFRITELPPGEGPKSNKKPSTYLTEVRRWMVNHMTRDGHDDAAIAKRLGVTETTVRRLKKNPPRKTTPALRYRRLVRLLRGGVAHNEETLRYADAEGLGYEDPLPDPYWPQDPDEPRPEATVGDRELWVKDAREALRDAQSTEKMLRGLDAPAYRWETEISVLVGHLHRLGAWDAGEGALTPYEAEIAEFSPEDGVAFGGAGSTTPRRP